MARRIPDYATALQTEVNEAIALTRAAERIRVEASRVTTLRGEMTTKRLDLVYEVAYLKIFASWEGFLQDAFFRYLCGYRNSRGQQTPATTFSVTLASAKSRVLGTYQFMLWHNPDSVIRRSRKFFSS